MSHSIPVAVFLITAAVSTAQVKPPDDSWLMQNYHFVRGPAPGEIKPVSPSVAQLQEIQNTMLNIVWKADFDGDYEAALAAAWQATANAQLIGTLTGELKPPTPMPPRGASMENPEKPKPATRLYLIAFKDDTVQVATEFWRDKLMLHYTTTGGAHEQVRLDLVDWKRSEDLNRRLVEDRPTADSANGASPVGAR
jgi:hypothetical protein